MNESESKGLVATINNRIPARKGFEKRLIYKFTGKAKDLLSLAQKGGIMRWYSSDS
mgnify:CR=1 FL=1|jgi:hypothetical protein